MIIATALVSQAASANCQTATGFIRTCYDNANAPPAVVYKILIDQIYFDSLEDEEYRIGGPLIEAGLTQNMNADDVLRYFVSKYLEIEEQVKAQNAPHTGELCQLKKTG